MATLYTHTPATAEVVNIPDSQLAAALRAVGGHPEEEPITDTLLASLPSYLDLSYWDIRNLSGLEYCTNTEELRLGGNPMNNLTGLNQLPNLYKLNLDLCPNLRDLGGLENSPNLREVSIYATQIRDISALDNVNSIEIVYLYSSQVSDLSPLADKPFLISLDISFTPVITLAPLTGNTNIEKFYAEGCGGLSDISPLQQWPFLREVNLNNTGVQNIMPLADNTGFGFSDTCSLLGIPLDQPSICSGIPQIEARGAGVSWYSENYYCDQVPPVVTLNGASEVSITCPGIYAELGATASDDIDGEISNVSITGVVNGAQPGSYTVVYSAVDAVGNVGTAARAITVVDNTAPIITRLGSAMVSVNYGEPYVDEGATANDTCHGEITGDIGVDNPVNVNQVGSYTVTYSVVDGSGNTATPVTRTVNVLDTVPPALTLLGNGAPTIACGSTFTDPGASAQDIADGNISANIQVIGSVNTAENGQYVLTYSVSDAAGNAAPPLTRTVTVSDTAQPLIQLNGAPIITLSCGDVYQEPGYTATDTCDSSVSVTVAGLVNVNSAGTYTLTYTATDDTGNFAQISRSVVVEQGDNCQAVDISNYATDQNGDNRIDLSELLRVIQFYNTGGFYFCPDQNTEDGFCPGFQP